ncbi:hypothetical protein EV182_007907, partial [Spiromyces aspiralis]
MDRKSSLHTTRRYAEIMRGAVTIRAFGQEKTFSRLAMERNDTEHQIRMHKKKMEQWLGLSFRIHYDVWRALILGLYALSFLPSYFCLGDRLKQWMPSMGQTSDPTGADMSEQGTPLTPAPSGGIEAFPPADLSASEGQRNIAYFLKQITTLPLGLLTLARMYGHLMELYYRLRRIIQLMSLPQEDAQLTMSDIQVSETWPETGGISVQNLHVSYELQGQLSASGDQANVAEYGSQFQNPIHHIALYDVSVEIPGGSKVGIVGRTAAG